MLHHQNTSITIFNNVMSIWRDEQLYNMHLHTKENTSKFFHLVLEHAFMTILRSRSYDDVNHSIYDTSIQCSFSGLFGGDGGGCNIVKCLS